MSNLSRKRKKSYKKDVAKKVNKIIKRRVAIYKALFKLGFLNNRSDDEINDIITRCLVYPFNISAEKVVYKELSKDFQW